MRVRSKFWIPHQNTGIAHIKLGRALLGQKRYQDAVDETLTGYETLSKQTDPSVTWLEKAREDLVSAYEAMGRPEMAVKYRAEMEKAAEQTAAAGAGQNARK